jgi:hypothetical protein
VRIIINLSEFERYRFREICGFIGVVLLVLSALIAAAGFSN